MDEHLLLASRLALAATGVGGSLAVVVAASRRPRGSRGWLAVVAACVLLLAVTTPIGQFVDGFPFGDELASAWFVAFPLLAATFPDGRFVPRWSVWFVVASIAVMAGDAVTGRAFHQSDLWVVFAASQTAVGIGLLVYRYRTSATTPEREAVRWVLLGSIVTVAAFMAIGVVDGTIGEGGDLAVAKANSAIIPLALGLVIGLAWPRLWNVDAAFRAVIVGLVAGWSLGGVFAVARGVAAMLGADPPAAVGAGAAAVAVAAYPVVALSLRCATWLVYRDRLAPDVAVARLLASLDADDERDVAQRVTDATVVATGSPAVALTSSSPADAAVFTASSGGGVPGTSGFAVVFRGELLATLHAAPRRGESSLSQRDRRVIAALALHAAPALAGARALREAMNARADLVSAREEERRSLRRELHDDLGPALSGLALGAAAIARRVGATDPALAAAARELQADIGDAVERSREISHGLRPPVLDDLGLAAALRDRIGEGVDLDVGELGELPAAVDLAMLRIAQEAVTNVRRHASATRCRVELVRDGDGLRMQVVDDGVGMPRAVRPGLGLRSIRERATALGGRAQISPAAGGGTVVAVWLPVASVPAPDPAS